MRLVISWWFVAFGSLAAAPDETPANGGPSPPASATAKPADYGPAFEQLIQLGYPDATGAKYVKLTLHGETGRAAAERAMYERQSGGGLPLDGNAWLLPGGTETVTEFIHNGFEKVMIAKTAKRGGLMRALIGPAKAADAAPEGALPGDWKDIDVEAEAKKILKMLETQATEGQMLSNERWNYDDDGPTWCAKVLGVACHMYRAGHRDEANRITETLFGLAPEPILVVDYLINDLADREYNRVVAAFFEDQDWKAYHGETKEIVDRFTRGWKSREGAEILLTRLDKQLQGAKPVIKPLQGAVVKPEAVEIMDGWLTQTKPIPLKSKPCWLLGGDMLKFVGEQGYYGNRAEGENPDPGRIGDLHAMGMDGFIALTAAATDDTLIPTRLVRAYGGYHDGYSRRMSGSSGRESPGLAQYASMTRPYSRGEIARTILLETLPDQTNELSSALPGELQATAHQWWLQHRKSSPSELARHFLEFGSSQQIQISVLALAHSNDDENAQAVEKYILASEDITNHFHLVDQYLRIRRGKARGFFESYAKTLRELAGDPGEDDPLGNSLGNWQLREAGGVDKYLKKLSVYVSDVSPDKLLADMRKGDLGYKEGFPMLQAANGDKSIVHHIPALVAIARQQEAPDDQLKVLRAIQSLVYDDEPDLDSDEEHDALEKSYGEQFALSKDEWTYFLAQDTPGEGEIYGSAPTFAAAAAWTLEMIYFDQHSDTMGQLSRIMDTDELWTFCLDRAKRVLVEGPSADFPTMADEDRQVAIRKTLQPMSSREVLQHYEGLNLSEKLAWRTILDGYEDEPPAGVAGLYKHIGKINWPNLDRKDAALKKELQALTFSRILDQSVVERVMDEMLKNAERYQHLVLYFQTDGKGGNGVTLSVIEEDQMDEWNHRILEEGFPLLRDDTVKKIVGIYATDEDGEEIIGHRHEPARKDNAFPVQAPIDRIKALIEEGQRFYTILSVETAENLKKREAEQEEDPELDILPSL